MGGLLHLVQRGGGLGGAAARPGPSRCTECNKQTNKHSPKQHLAGGHSCHHSSPSRHSAAVVLKQDDSKLYHESTIKCFVLSAEHYRHCWTALVETLLVDLLASLRSQTDRAILRVIEYFAKSLKATQNHSK